MWWWNKEVKIPQQVRRRHLNRCAGSLQKKIRLNTNVKEIKQKKIVARAKRMEANQELNELYQNFNRFFYFLRTMKKESKGCKRRKVLKRKKRTIGFY